jgi:hypothetical protein
MSCAKELPLIRVHAENHWLKRLSGYLDFEPGQIQHVVLGIEQCFSTTWQS